MRIGIDFDGTLADTNSVKSHWILSELGLRVPPWRCDRTACVPLIGEAAYTRMAADVYEHTSAQNLPEVPNALDAVRLMQSVHTLVVVTARKDKLAEIALDWLSRRSQTTNVPLVSISPERPTKAEVCCSEKISVLIDDDERHLLGLDQIGVLPILFKHDAPSTFHHPSLFVHRTWQEVHDALAIQ